MTPSGIEPATFRFVAQHLNHCPTAVPGINKVKVKVHPRTGHRGPEGEWRYSCTFSLTMALDGGGWSVPHPAGIPPGKLSQD